ncbi:MAG: acylphosphatase [Elusimicrobiota bacterium]|nr:acylphosphatase [Elusimicrobiota bacterium]
MTGRVQGVGYRWFVRQSAQSLGLGGWVRNREDGTVEAEVEGSAAALDELVARLKDGNPAARVDSIETRPVPPRGETGFRIAV